MSSNITVDNINKLANMFNIYFPNDKNNMFVKFPPDNNYGKILQEKFKSCRKNKKYK